jgi:hypothetical protein
MAVAANASNSSSRIVGEYSRGSVDKQAHIGAKIAFFTCYYLAILLINYLLLLTQPVTARRAEFAKMIWTSVTETEWRHCSLFDRASLPTVPARSFAALTHRGHALKR